MFPPAAWLPATLCASVALQRFTRTGRGKLLAQVHGAIHKAIQMPEIKTKLDSVGATAVVSPPAEFGEFLKKESAVWGGLVQELGIQWD